MGTMVLLLRMGPEIVGTGCGVQGSGLQANAAVFSGNLRFFLATRQKHRQRCMAA